MSWPLTLPFSEAAKYRSQLDEVFAKHGRNYQGKFAMMRHTSVYQNAEDRQAAIDALRSVLAQFGSLMIRSGEVRNGFPDLVPLNQLEGNARVDPDILETHLIFGSPNQMIDKLR